ncbi:MAG: chorismate synthase [Anaerolineae bacterium]|jgi:chorismate synthase|nr:chorismate synthase [Anaerolineae bacterium]
MEILGGPLFGVAGAGESHGPAYTTIVFGCPPGLRLRRSEIQRYLDRRRPGGSRHGTPRSEADQVLLLSGLYDDDPDVLLAGPEAVAVVAEKAYRARTYQEGSTTGEPIAALVISSATQSRDYAQFAGPQGEARPGHADLVKHYQSRGTNDPRGGGRSSYRATISDVIGGAIARIFLETHFQTVILSSVIQVGDLRASRSLADEVHELVADHTQAEPVPLAALRAIETRLTEAAIPSVDHDFAERAATVIERIRGEGDSLGSCVEVIAVNVPPLAGTPLYQSLKLRLMGALGGLNAAQSCEVGDGFAVVSRRGSENNDAIRSSGFQTNHQGGLLGGITTGMPLVCRVGFKPTSSILLPQASVRKDLSEVRFVMHEGRHDPCAGIRAGITLESRMSIELLNAVLAHQATALDTKNFVLFR